MTSEGPPAGTRTVHVLGVCVLLAACSTRTPTTKSSTRARPVSAADEGDRCGVREARGSREEAHPGTETVLVGLAAFQGTRTRSGEAQDAIVERLRGLAVELAKADRKLHFPSLSFVRLDGPMRSHEQAAACATRHRLSVLLWGSVYEAPGTGSNVVTVRGSQRVNATAAPATGSITSRDSARARVGNISTTMRNVVVIPAAQPFALRLNATSPYDEGPVMAGTRIDLGNLADITDQVDLSSSALASVPFVAAHTYLDRAQYPEAARLFSIAGRLAPRSKAPNEFVHRSRILAAMATLHGGGTAQEALALIDALRITELSPAVEWQARMVRGAALQFLGRQAEALREFSRARSLNRKSGAGDREAASMAKAATLLRAGMAVEAWPLLAERFSITCGELPTRILQLECEARNIFVYFLRARALQWNGEAARAEECYAAGRKNMQRAISGAVDKSEALLAASHIARSLLAVQDDCGIIHLGALDDGLAKQMLGHEDPVDVADMIAIAKGEPPVRAVRMYCAAGLMASLVGAKGDATRLYDIAEEMLRGQGGSRLLRAELKLGRAMLMGRAGSKGKAARAIREQLPVLRSAFGSRAPAVEAWTGYVASLEGRSRPPASWRTPTLDQYRRCTD